MILRLHTPLLRTCFNFCLPEPYQVAARRSFFVRESCGLNRFCSLYLTVPSAVQSTLCSLKNVSDIVLARPKASVLDVSCVPTSLVHAFKNYAVPLLCTFAASSEAQSYLVGGQQQQQSVVAVPSLRFLFFWKYWSVPTNRGPKVKKST